MHPSGFRYRSHSQKGMSLIEAMVAVLVFTVVFMAALALYQSANKAYMATDAATIQQQNARYALDRIGETMRDAGANYNPTGALNIPDEQVEGAWEAAIWVRGDFDNSAETALQTATFPLVTTGNDEIVGYVLMKNGAGTIPISIKADLGTAGGRTATLSGTTVTGETTKTLNVASSTLAGETDPPYQLARVTFNDDGTFNTKIVADNIFRLSFTYFDKNGAAVAINSGADADRATRATIRKIGVNLITMADRADPGYTDPNTYSPAEAAATKTYRKFSLSEQILAVNLGVVGARHLLVPAITIGAPPSFTVCTGHDFSYYFSWAPSATSGIIAYNIHVDSVTPVLSLDLPVAGFTEYRWRQPDRTARAFTFSVAAQSGISISPYSPTVTKTAWHDTTNSIPSVPANVAGTGGTGNTMAVSWDPVVTSTGTITNSTACTTAGTGAGVSAPPATWNNEAPDLSYYEVYRGLFPTIASGASLVPSATTRVDNKTVGSIVNTPHPSTNAFVDNTAAPCAQYFYAVKAFDTADLVAPGNGSTAMTATAKYIPAAGVTPAKPAAPTPVGAVVHSGGNYTVTLKWTAVGTDSTGAPAATAHYQVVREKKIGLGAWTVDNTSQVYEVTQMSAAQVIPDTSGGQPVTYRYAINAVYDCGTIGNSDRSNTSDYYYLTCTPPVANTFDITNPQDGVAVPAAYISSITPQVTVGSTGWTGATAFITDQGGNTVWTGTATFTTSGVKSFSPAWDITSVPSGPTVPYTLTATGALAGGCSVTDVSNFTLDTSGCNLQITAAAYSGSGSNLTTELTFTINNPCGVSTVPLSALTFTWGGVTTSPARYVTSIVVGSTTVATPTSTTNGGTGVKINFSAAQTLAPGNTTVVVDFNDKMTSNGTRTGSRGYFTSVGATTGNVTDEMVISGSIP
jgi:hypothetical protein